MLYDIGKLLKQKRKEKGLTLEEAGKLIGVSKVTYRDYELNNIKSARMDKIKTIADFLEISPEDLFNNEKLEEISKKEFAKEVSTLLNKTVNINEQEKALLIHTLNLICSDKK